MGFLCRKPDCGEVGFSGLALRRPLKTPPLGDALSVSCWLGSASVTRDGGSPDRDPPFFPILFEET
jgi:hypothetical protein